MVAMAEDPVDGAESPRRWSQFVAAAFATICAASSGSVLGWSSPSLPILQRQQWQLLRDNTSVNLTLLPAIVTEEEASWAGSLVPLGALLGSLPSGFLADAFGRKPVMMAIGVHFLAGWLLILAATLRRGVWFLFCGRALQGACCGAITVVAPLYLEEIAEAQVRGCTGVLFDLATNAGVLSAYALGALLAPPALAGALAALPAIFLVAFAWMPESPVHLAARGRDAPARRALEWLRPGRDVTDELAEMRELLRTSGRLQPTSSSTPAPDTEKAEKSKEGGKDCKAVGAGTEKAGKKQRISLPALLTLSHGTGAGGKAEAESARGRRYSINLFAAAQHEGSKARKLESSGVENPAFEDAPPSPSAVVDMEPPASCAGRHPPLEARSSTQPILQGDGVLATRGGAGAAGRLAALRRWMHKARLWTEDLRWGSPASRSLCIVFCLMVIRPASGINAITFYTVSIFSQAGTSLSPSMATVLIGTLLVPCNLLASRLVDRVGRRVLLLGSCTGITLCYALFVGYYSTDAAPRWLPVLAVSVFTVSFCLGLGPLPWVLMSELLPIRHRRWAAGAASAVAWAGAFAVTKCFGTALAAVGPKVLYSVFLGSAFTGGLFVALCVPETRGKTRQELQAC